MLLICVDSFRTECRYEENIKYTTIKRAELRFGSYEMRTPKMLMNQVVEKSSAIPAGLEQRLHISSESNREIPRPLPSYWQIDIVLRYSVLRINRE